MKMGNINNILNKVKNLQIEIDTHCRNLLGILKEKYPVGFNKSEDLSMDIGDVWYDDEKGVLVWFKGDSESRKSKVNATLLASDVLALHNEGRLNYDNIILYSI